MTMNEAFLHRISQLSPKRLALLAAELQAKLEASQPQNPEPIAIIGLGCRFPGGGNSPQAYWELLQEGRDAITEVLPSRWNIDAYYDPDPDAPGKMSSRWGGFIEAVDQFEPQFFGIAPREAVSMDPQQRLLLEVAWEALENAGYSPEGLGGSQTGVFVGICNNDYYQLLLAGDDSNFDTYLATGSAFSVASGRLSYVLGLQGPSLSVDTACSSSLVAIHLAIQSLRKRECNLALAGGVNLILGPEVTIILSKAKMMATDGRCKAFDARADGFVRSEGCGIVALKRLSDAQADGDNILALIRGSAMNQDGRSNGLTAPNGPSQEAVIRAALADAGLTAGEISYIETHGTGTSLGDPIEVQALGSVMRSEHTAENPVMIGSVKTNLGHLESAAGVAGVIKLVLALQHAEIPPHLHLQQLNPYIAWEEYPLVVPTERTPWLTRDGRRLGGISSFGFSGTNVHIILENAPPPHPAKVSTERPVHLLTLSAKDETALQHLAARFEHHLATDTPETLADVCFTANIGRSHFGHRLAVIATDRDQLRQTLAAFANDQASPGERWLNGQVRGTRQPEISFLYAGQGSQYIGMGRQLYETQPTFRLALEKCDELLRPYLDQPLLAILYPEAGTPAVINETTYTQPALFALQYALTELWRSWGIIPAAVMGHSVGEYAAACAAGVFSLEDGLKLIAARGRLMQTTSNDGEMAAVFASESYVSEVIAPYGESVSIAAVNGPETVVISGKRTVVQAVIDHLKNHRVKARRLNVSIAGHSPLMDPILEEFEQQAAEISYSAPQIEFISGLTGRVETGDEITTPAYWRRNLRDAVQFFPAIQKMHEQGYRVFLEIGPAPILTDMAARCLPDTDKDLLLLHSLRPQYDDWQQMLKSLGKLYTRGVQVDWAGFEHDYAAGRRRVPLPTYPFQRERYWLKPTAPRRSQETDEIIHPLLGKRLSSPALEDIVFESRLNATWPPFLDHHRIYDMVILPSPGYIEMALQAAMQGFGAGSYGLKEFTIHQALVLPEEAERTVQVILTPGTGEEPASFRIVSLDESRGDWLLHATGRVETASPESLAIPLRLDTAALQTRCPEEISGEVYYERLYELGLEFGSNFRGITHVWRGDGEALGVVQLPDALVAEAGNYEIHPAFLDACFHLLGAPLGDIETAYLLIGIDKFRLYRSPGTKLWNHTVLHQENGSISEAFTGHVHLFDDTGELVAAVEGLHLRRAGRDALLRATQQRVDDDWFYRVEWQSKAHPDQLLVEPAAAPYLLEPGDVAAQVNPHLSRLSAQYGLATYPQLFARLDTLSAAYIVEAFQKLGWKFQVGQRVSTAALAQQLGVVKRHHHLLTRLLEILHQEGILRQVDSAWEVASIPAVAESQTELDSLLAQYPLHEAQLRLIEQCGPYLAEVLQGIREPLHLLFPNGSLASTEKVYQEAPFARAYNTLMQEVVVAALACLPADRTIRILEIGAGTGSTTASILPQLPANQTEYVFTDVSPLFTTRAAEKFSDYHFVRYELLDIERDPADQGFAAHKFDLIIAANVLHATSDLNQTLAHIKQLLTSQGLLVLLEGTAPQSWVDLTFGLTEGWWKFTDTGLRTSYPLLSRNEWLGLLSAQGFTRATSVPDPKEDQLVDQAIFLARGPVVEAPVALPEQPGRWLIFMDETGLGQRLAELLEQRGEQCLFVSPGSTFATLAEYHWQLDPTRPEDFERLVSQVIADGERPCRGIVHLWSLEPSPEEITVASLETNQELNCASLLHLMQALAKTEGPGVPRVWLATRGAETVNSPTTPPELAQITMWGLGRVVALEHPDLWGGLIDLDAAGSPAENAAWLLTEIWRNDGEDQTAWRAGQRYVPRLVRQNRPKAQPGRIDPEGTYLVTGGLGGLGLKVAHWLAEQGGRYLVLTGRRGLPPRDQWATLPADSRAWQQVAAIQTIEALGATVIVEAVDVSDPARMAGLFEQFGRSLPPLKGVIHAAAALSNWKLQEMPMEALLAMLKPKVTGTWILHELTKEMDLDFVVLFSSTTALLGSSSLGHYAAANHFLDGFAHYRRALGLPALSINWGTWDEMRAASAEEQNLTAQFGLGRMPSALSLALLGDLLGASDLSQIMVAAVDWNRLKPAYEARRQRPFLEQIQARSASTKISAKKNKQTVSQKSPLRQQLEATRSNDRLQIITAYVKDEVVKVLGLDASRPLDLQQGLFEMGLDSLMSVELKSRLEAGLEQSLPSTLIFNYPAIADLVDYLNAKVLPQEPAAPAPVDDLPPGLEVPLPTLENAADVDDLSEDEITALLMQKLDQLK